MKSKFLKIGMSIIGTLGVVAIVVVDSNSVVVTFSSNIYTLEEAKDITIRQYDVLLEDVKRHNY